MRNSSNTKSIGLSLIAGLILAGCGGGSGGGQVAKPEWKMTLAVEGQAVSWKIEAMNVYLNDDETLPEPFEIVGDGVLLFGSTDSNTLVGYDENWKKLEGKSLQLNTKGGYPMSGKETFITLPGGAKTKVMSGTFAVENYTGKWAGQDGDMTLSGKITLVIESESGPKSLTGTLSVHCITWG